MNQTTHREAAAQEREQDHTHRERDDEIAIRKRLGQGKREGQRHRTAQPAPPQYDSEPSLHRLRTG